MKQQAQFSLATIEKFFLEHLPELREYEHLTKWLEWADSHGFLLRVFPDKREVNLVAAALVRPIAEACLDNLDPYAFDPDGEILFMDFCAAPGKDAQRALGFAVLQRFGPRLAVAFDSHKRGVRVHSFNKIRKALFNTKTT